MKRRDLERILKANGCILKREGSSYSIWINPKNKTIETIPRHKEIKEEFAKKILKSLGVEK
jgi:predicted RNA binding protein YcfA (HicA-like mRNA interferase family)